VSWTQFLNNDNWPDWRDMPPRWRILIVVFAVVWLALSLCGLPSLIVHCAPVGLLLLLARLLDIGGVAGGRSGQPPRLAVLG
jgi:hypothetical protein